MAIQKITSQIIGDGIISAADLASGSVTPGKLEANTAGTLLTTDGSAVVWKAQTALAVANTQITGTLTGSQISSNTLSNTVFQTSSVENYMNAQGFGMGMRNRIINGAMVIDQRNAGASVNPSGTAGAYTLDRWIIQRTVTGKFSVQQNAGSVTPPAGYTNYLGVTSLSAYTVGSTDNFWVGQHIEGYNIADLAWGTASAKTVTLSFWVRSSLTGNFGGSLSNSGTYNRFYPFTYTISSANTWEQKIVTITGCPDGSWNTGNTGGILVLFGLGYGSTYGSGTAGAWVAADQEVPTGSTSVVGTNGATLYITGVQLEKGSVATPFEQRPFGQELALCQRYYFKLQSTAAGCKFGSSFNYTTTQALGVVSFPVPMRTSPTALEQTGTAGDYSVFITSTGTVTCSSVATFNSGCTNTSDLFFNVASGLTAGQGSVFRATNATAYLAWSAEL